MTERMKNAAQSKRPEPHQQTTIIGNDENYRNDTADSCFVGIIGVIVAVLCFMAGCGFSRPLLVGERIATRHCCGVLFFGNSFGRRALTVAPAGDPSGSLLPTSSLLTRSAPTTLVAGGVSAFKPQLVGTPIMILHHVLEGRASSAVSQAVSTAPRIAANAAHVLGVL